MTRVAVVAGVGPGLGASIVRRFAAEGCSVALLARSESYLNELAAEVAEGPGEALAVPTDLADPDEIRSAFEEVRGAFGPVDVLVNHASSGSWKGLRELSVEELDHATAVGVRGAFVCAQEAVDDMLERGETEGDEKTGTVLFTGATSAVRGRDGALGFSAAKFGARGMAESMAKELGSEGVHVAHVVLDGGIRPPNREVEDEAAYLDPDDIAETYWRLVEQDASTMTFETHITNGPGDIEFL
ncbi:short-chain dehydrogenase/reductase SDR [Halogeometricum pallidum JCM 14848]|uniref:Short-chain dehydrogenase/reductase SDR n=1 Tax=Halogeometricum pallidum JCM 14848 TaxID=1227487 RepID=M0DA47_HALPD|nr:SDR family NAD(P)-dependent oxidoreductase [Halogeometricum pallidum]ELZ31014.1 short-chain dehydrogenase/reductase SDR [Halogeometricum pallidum JCM 14848]